MRKTLILSVMAMTTVIQLIFSRELGLSHKHYPEAPHAECALVGDDKVVVKYEEDGAFRSLIFNKTGFYSDNRSDGVRFKHWNDDMLAVNDRHVPPDELESVIVTDFVNFQVDVDITCFDVIQSHSLMKWASHGSYY